jgi:hypothetical protein
VIVDEIDKAGVSAQGGGGRMPRDIRYPSFDKISALGGRWVNIDIERDRANAKEEGSAITMK